MTPSTKMINYVILKEAREAMKGTDDFVETLIRYSENKLDGQYFFYDVVGDEVHLIHRFPIVEYAGKHSLEFREVFNVKYSKYDLTK